MTETKDKFYAFKFGISKLFRVSDFVLRVFALKIIRPFQSWPSNEPLEQHQQSGQESFHL
jgi:hypothetical protein